MHPLARQAPPARPHPSPDAHAQPSVSLPSQVDFEILGDLTFEDIKEIGVIEIGPRRKVFRAIAAWKEERDIKKAEAIRAKMSHLETSHPPAPTDETSQRLHQLRHSLSSLGSLEH